MKSHKLTSTDLKLALLEYFRFKRQAICVDECQNVDIMIDTGKEIIEIETKISKSDLKADLKKTIGRTKKHDAYANPRSNSWLKPNKFYFCVPDYLEEFALKFAKDINPKYGVFVFDSEIHNRQLSRGHYSSHVNFLRVSRKGRKLHDRYNEKLKWQIALRASSKLITLMQKQFKEKIGWH